MEKNEFLKIINIVLMVILFICFILFCFNSYAYSNFIDNPARKFSEKYALLLMSLNIILAVISFFGFCFCLYMAFIVKPGTELKSFGIEEKKQDQISSGATPSTTPGANLSATPSTTPGANLSATPGVTPGATPGANLGANLGSTPGATPGATPGVTPGTNLGTNLGVTPGVTPGTNLGANPGANPGANLLPIQQAEQTKFPVTSEKNYFFQPAGQNQIQEKNSVSTQTLENF